MAKQKEKKQTPVSRLMEYAGSFNTWQLRPGFLRLSVPLWHLFRSILSGG